MMRRTVESFFVSYTNWTMIGRSRGLIFFINNSVRSDDLRRFLTVIYPTRKEDTLAIRYGLTALDFSMITNRLSVSRIFPDAELFADRFRPKTTGQLLEKLKEFFDQQEVLIADLQKNESEHLKCLCQLAELGKNIASRVDDETGYSDRAIELASGVLVCSIRGGIEWYARAFQTIIDNEAFIASVVPINLTGRVFCPKLFDLVQIVVSRAYVRGRETSVESIVD